MAEEYPEDLIREEHAVDVSEKENQFRIQCTDVRLVKSSLAPLQAGEGEDTASHFSFRIRVSAKEGAALALLDVQVRFFPERDDPESGYALRFTMAATFLADDELAAEEMGEFARLYTLTVVWPYAREYTTDQLRRTGAGFLSLPIINPQVVTEDLIEGGLIEVTLQTES